MRINTGDVYALQLTAEVGSMRREDAQQRGRKETHRESGQ